MLPSAAQPLAGCDLWLRPTPQQRTASPAPGAVSWRPAPRRRTASRGLLRLAIARRQGAESWSCRDKGAGHETAEDLVDTVYTSPWMQALKMCTRAVLEYGLQGNWQQAVGLVRVTQEEGLSPDVFLYNKAIVACQQNGCWRIACGILHELRHNSRGLRADAVSYGATLAAATDLASVSTGLASGMFGATDGRRTRIVWTRALHLLRGCLEDGAQPDAALFRAGMNACGQGQQWEPSILLLKAMRELALEVGTPAYRTAMISVSSSRDSWAKVLDIFSDLQGRRDLDLDTTSLNSAFLAFIHGGQPSKALSLLQKTQFGHPVEPNVMTYTMAIGALEQSTFDTDADGSSAWSLALYMLGVAKQAGVQPNAVSFTSAMGVCDRGLQWQRAQDLLRRAQQEEMPLDNPAFAAAIKAILRPASSADVDLVPPDLAARLDVR
ncbi:unnamed protein product [Polarella glacialis]|uniref:Pentatricopeptide repeat-containing protein, chloroplastic n=1 Tax=Polarella glacialis TaxID=89957 RepID=A0A813I129_POLGL|nr:unnamed protein product [Polarella glacialis]CAE8643487.1 unnamed protein product [Polarella glacialis]